MYLIPETSSARVYLMEAPFGGTGFQSQRPDPPRLFTVSDCSTAASHRLPRAADKDHQTLDSASRRDETPLMDVDGGQLISAEDVGSGRIDGINTGERSQSLLCNSITTPLRGPSPLLLGVLKVKGGSPAFPSSQRVDRRP